MSIAELAAKYINHTNKHVFLTGKAGTGKTTFLKAIVENTHKHTIVAAPTGIAAINAGGVTLHSLFQLPFGSFIPENSPLNQNIQIQVNTPRSLMSNFQMHKTKRSMLREMELLIIDEVSMLRADLLDAIDTILRSVRRNSYQSFGGVQVLFIGDMLQLPPVVKEDEWRLLSSFYPNLYFFSARSLQNNQPCYLELDKIYRQQDDKFISLLNNFRDDKVTPNDIEILNQHYEPQFNPSANQGYIHLTTHNYKADQINQKELTKLPGKPFSFHAVIDGNFKEHLYPIDAKLDLKKGAQVMFIKNDYSGEQRYFNGKIGTICEIDDTEVYVEFNDGSDPVQVDPYTWESKKYSLNPDNNQIEEQITGTFSHLPLKLAWAVTVHKSQGLTFDKAIIDVSEAFAPGQVYVALSRLTSLDGLKLLSPVPQNGLQQDKSLYRYVSDNVKDSDDLLVNLKKESLSYLLFAARQAYSYDNLIVSMQNHVNSYDKDEKKSAKQEYKSWAVELFAKVKELKAVADKFSVELSKIEQNGSVDLNHLMNRIQAAKTYFEPRINELSKSVQDHLTDLEGVSRIKKYINELKDLDRLVFARLQGMYKCEALLKAFINNSEINNSDFTNNEQLAKREEKARENKTKKKPKKKKDKGPNTKEISFQLYKDGKDVKEIAKERGMAITTIEGHLAHYVSTGEIDVAEFVNKTDLDIIIKTIKKLDDTKLSPLKNELNHKYSYTELKMAVAYYQFNNAEKN